MLCAGLAHAAPTAKIMRIDPRASMDSGVPLISMVVDLSEWRSTSDALAGCGTPNSSNDYLDCAADSLERGEATYKPLKWPGEPASGEPDIGAEKQNAQLLVTVDGVDMPAEYTARTRWGKSKDQPGVGTAYLILIDASGSMGGRLDHAKMVAKAFIDKKDRNDIFNIKAFNDIAVLPGSGWLNDANALRGAIDSVAKTSATQGRARPLFNLIKQATIDGFSELGNVGQRVETPMHQALIVLSDGWAGTDASSAPPLAIELGNYLAKGILDENNLTLPRMPIPVVSVWFPVTAMEEFFENSREFMKNLPVPSVGGGFFLVRDGKENRAGNIVAAVKRRFDQMHIVKWKVACLQPNLNQTLKLAFIRTSVNIAGDSFVNAPLGVDPTLWPLDVNVEETTKAASKDPIYPGGKVQIYGNFCWGNDAQRAELYLIPKNQDLPETIKNMTVEDAKSLRDSLTKGGFRGTAIKSGENFVEFQLPDNEKFLTGKEDNYTARIIVLDGKSKRFSAVTQSAVISVKAKKPPMSLVTMLLIGGGAFGGTVILLLLVTVFRSGGKRRGGGGGPPPRPVVAAGGPAPAPFPQPAPVMPGPMPMAPAPAPMGPPGGAPSPFGAPPAAAAPQMVQQATLSGPPGMFPITPGREVRAGRDPGTCEIVLSEPRVSGTHATMKIDGGQLFVRDEGSNNGTFVNGGRIQAHVWTPVGQGASVKFGPIEFSVRLE
ncbi:MAG: FHA domain-containing protein [Polyangiaceae bacterium]|nr:FHA domain-containing protein [Polyangiaceae bacterium]